MNDELKNDIIKYFKESGTKPLTVHELEEIFAMHDVEEFKSLVQTLNELEMNGMLIRTRKNRFGLPEKMNLIRGKIDMNRKGFAFLIPDEEGLEDVYIHASDLNSAMHQDQVIVRIEKKGRRDSRAEGVVIRVLKRAATQIVGTFEESRSFGFVIPDDTRVVNDIFISKTDTLGAITGHKVIVKITQYTESRKSAEGEVIEILGHKNDPGIDILSIIYKHGLKIDFPSKVLNEAAAIPEQVTIEEMQGRRDLRDEIIMTIDGADAKDLDDAIRVETLDNGNYLLGVYIADVSHYVTENSPIDKEAYSRATSVYLVDRVIPMIPHRLSNGICSLNRGQDRLVLACEMEVDKNGIVVGHEIFEGVINTTERMTYENVNKILVDEDEAVIKEFEALVPHFQAM